MIASPPGAAGSAVIREARGDDIVRLLELEDSAFDEEAWTREMIEDELAGPDRRYFVVEVGGRVAGYAGVFLGLDSAEIMTIAIEPAVRRRGLGRRLMETLLDCARQAGLGQVMLEVAATSPPAINLYKSLGFEEIGRRLRYYQPSGRDALVMRLWLGPVSLNQHNHRPLA
ncbi:MAG: ribosomal protein S18-alanine N-acetyltransferase [Bifidobacteriaceae bacterium]|jgi:ribosomal-protein-alanine acetyltransferase|nr:ribosomal protein S18-alanine N-acetyltransferase [Bifidobacteriaceae bacterium]